MAPFSRYASHGWKSSPSSFEHRKGSRRRLSKQAIKNLFLLLVAAGLAGSIGILALFAYVSRDLPDPNALTERVVKQSTKIYDRTGTHLLYEFFNEENRTLVKMQEGFCKDKPLEETNALGIPLRMLQATITAEDRKFCSHHGFVLTSFLRALLANLRGERQGASTLTQQLVKNAILSNEKTLTRKAKELILSLELERRYSKDEILQIYFNEIPYGSTLYGVQAASQSYFGKTVDQLTLAEVATLAALPRAPTTYLNNPDLLVARRDWILDGMVEMGFVPAEKVAAAKKQETPVKVKVTNITAPHFVFYVKEQLEDVYGRRQVEEGGLKVITSLDYDLQTAAEQAVTDGVNARGKQYQFTNASLVAIDPKNGQILSMVGSKDYFNNGIQGQVNVATRPRQPGSSFKPIVYANAFTKGYSPNTILWDIKTEFPTVTGVYTPNNYDLKERGPIRVRDALQGSLNIPAVQMSYLVGVDSTLDFATTLGYSLFGDHSKFGLSIVLGGGEVKLLEHTNAYAIFANEGVYHDPVAILKVEDAEGRTLQEWRETDGQKVVEPNIARMLSDVLSDNNARAYIFGLNSNLQLDARPVAAKTGTTNDYHDAWTMGYTPSIAVGVWVGNNNNDAMKRGADGSIIAAPIWNQFMKAALKDKPIESFTSPEIPVTGKAMIDGIMPGTLVTVDRASGKLATEYTPPSYRRQRLYAEYHSTLRYIDREDPLGPSPANPIQDPYYVPWETAVQNWIARREAETGIQVNTSTPPTEYDDVHVPSNFPTVIITQPPNGAELASRVVDIGVTASAPRSISRVEFYLDDAFLGLDAREPYLFRAVIPNSVARGYHTLKAVAYDDIDNSGSATVGVLLSTDATGTTFEIVDPKNSQTIERIQETYTVVASLEKPDQYRSVKIVAESPLTGEKIDIGSKLDPTSPFISFPWNLPISGDWALSALATPKDGSATIETAGILVHVVPAGPASPSGDLNPFPNP